MPVLNLIRRVLVRIAGPYDFWRIYSIETAQCCEPRAKFNIMPIEDLSIFDAPELDPELRRANWHRQGAMGYAAWKNGALAGVCWFWPGPLLQERNVGIQPSDCAELIQITVASRFRGMGLASALIDHAGCILRDRGYRRLYAQVWRTNVPSARAFAKCGWDHVAWFIQLRPSYLSRPLCIRRIRSDFHSQPGLLESWGRTPQPLLKAQTTTINAHWQPGPQSLKFTASDATLGQFHFRALVSEVPITSLCGMQDPPLPPPESSRLTLGCAVIRNFPLSKDLNTFQLRGSWLRYIPIRYSRFLVKREGCFEEYLGKFSSKSRKNLRRSVSKVEKEAGSACYWREYRTFDEVPEFLALAANMSRQTYQSQLFHEGVENNVATLNDLERLTKNDLFRGYILYIKDEPAAFVLCEAKERVLLYKTVGYVPKYREYSPGTVLLYHILERFFAEESFDFLDFGEGEGFYKEFFANLSLRCARVYYFRLRPVVVAVVLAHCLWNLATTTAHRVPGAAALVKKIRRLLRGQATAKLELSQDKI